MTYRNRRGVCDICGMVHAFRVDRCIGCGRRMYRKRYRIRVGRSTSLQDEPKWYTTSGTRRRDE